MENTLYGKKKLIILPKTSLFSVSNLFKYENAEKHAKTPFMEKHYNFTKRVHFECVWSCYAENEKMHANNSIWGNEKTLQKTCVIRVFELLR